MSSGVQPGAQLSDPRVTSCKVTNCTILLELQVRRTSRNSPGQTQTPPLKSCLAASRCWIGIWVISDSHRIVGICWCIKQPRGSCCLPRMSRVPCLQLSLPGSLPCFSIQHLDCKRTLCIATRTHSAWLCTPTPLCRCLTLFCAALPLDCPAPSFSIADKSPSGILLAELIDFSCPSRSLQEKQLLY